MNGGDLIAEVLVREGVRHLFTLCGGHISPILVGAKQKGIRVVDVRDEANAVFAADACSRLTGTPGVAAVTAGPGATNTITAVKNAQLAQSAIVVFGGATATVLKGRGSLQDIDQMALFAPHVKWAVSVARVRDLASTVERGFRVAVSGVPGPVFIETPLDLLYDEEMIREWYGAKSSRTVPSLGDRAVSWYLRRHLNRVFAPARSTGSVPMTVDPVEPSTPKCRRLAARLERAERPLLLIGSQALLHPEGVSDLVSAIEEIGAPVYLTGMARGLLGRGHPLQMRHRRKQALRAADLVVLAGVPADFRLDYGRHVPRSVFLASLNLSPKDLRKNRRPDLGILGDPASGLRLVASRVAAVDRSAWIAQLDSDQLAREEEIGTQAAVPTDFINPLELFRRLDSTLPEDSVLVADGGDFVATASYILSPRRPLSWLDPGVFGTLGVGGGFALGAALCRPEAEIWIIWGDGSAAYSLAEFDTYVRHGVPVIGIVGNDASWAQIARDQVSILEDDVGTVLRPTDYHRVAEGYGGRGYLLEEIGQLEGVMQSAREDVAKGLPVLINVRIGKTDFRKGSISL